jgi:hypothetical protein
MHAIPRLAVSSVEAQPMGPAPINGEIVRSAAPHPKYEALANKKCSGAGIGIRPVATMSTPAARKKKPPKREKCDRPKREASPTPRSATAMPPAGRTAKLNRAAN